MVLTLKKLEHCGMIQTYWRSARTADEPGFLIIDRIMEKHLSGVVTYRKPVIRIISVRRSHVEEVILYESQGIR